VNFQEIVLKLQSFWARQGCALLQPYDMEKGAGTFNPATFFGAVGPKPVRAAYVEPCRRPADGRYGDNPNRLGKYYQFQVLLKPPPRDPLGLYAQSLKALGLHPAKHDLRFLEDDWQSPTLGASGLGWEARLDGLEISQLTYFQQMASVPVDPPSFEITYGLERIAMYLQKKESVFDLDYDGARSYGELHLESERQFSRYHFEEADVERLLARFEESEAEGLALLPKSLPLPAYDCVVRMSHAFNVLEARGTLSVTQRAQAIARVRNLARKVIEAYLKAGDEPRPEAAIKS
jgi:glycyl-tRNA synthetase alpha chain